MAGLRKDVHSVCELHFAASGNRCIGPGYFQKRSVVVEKVAGYGQAADGRRRPGIAGLLRLGRWLPLQMAQATVDPLRRYRQSGATGSTLSMES